MNFSDSERIAAMLQKQGYRQAKSEKEADLIVLNACSVRQSAIDRVYAQVHRYYKTKKIILAGCFLAEDKKKLSAKANVFWDPSEYFSYKPARQNPNIAYVPIMTGCNNFCAYCAVPYTRGREFSRSAAELEKEIRDLVKKGHKEIMLLGQNVNSYKSEARNPKSETNSKSKNQKLKTTIFPQLLKLIIQVPGDFKIRFMTSHPKDMSDELIDIIAKSPKISKDIHLPLQAGDTAILRKMNRKYTAGHYLSLIKKIRRKIPNVIISTDIIVGFPGENEKQFENTVKLCQKAKFSKAYVSQYSPRPGTTAAKMEDDVPKTEKKRRWKILDELINKK